MEAIDSHIPETWQQQPLQEDRVGRLAPPIQRKKAGFWTQPLTWLILGISALVLLLIALIALSPQGPEIMGGIVVVGIMVLIGALYFLPSICAYGHQNATAIFLLNLLLGWTFVGWAIALIWSATRSVRVRVINSQGP